MKRYGRYGDVRIARFDGQEVGLHLMDERAYIDYTRIGIGYISAFDPLTADSEVILDDPHCDVYDTIPLSITIPRESAIKAMVQFIETGKRPTCIQWRK